MACIEFVTPRPRSILIARVCAHRPCTRECGTALAAWVRRVVTIGPRSRWRCGTRRRCSDHLDVKHWIRLDGNGKPYSQKLARRDATAQTISAACYHCPTVAVPRVATVTANETSAAVGGFRCFHVTLERD